VQNRVGTPGSRLRILPESIVLLIPAAVKFLLHVFTVKGWGLHGDELYYLACSDHMDWGYVDQPPLSLFLLHVQRVVFGDSMLSIRFLPALCGACTVLLTGLLARRMGAGIFGQLLAEICALIAPLYLAINHFFSMNCFDTLFWTVALYLIVCLVNGGRPALWLWFGLVIGIGCENKISVLFLCFGLGVGLLLTEERRLLFTRWIWYGALLGALLILPNIFWQLAHGWPTLEWMANARAQKMAAMSLPAYLREQVVLMEPLTVLVWGTGLIALLLYPPLRTYRSLGWCYLAVLAVFVFQGGKAYYLGPMYPALFAGGAIAIERWLSGQWIRVAVAGTLLAAGVMTAPLGMPLLPVETFIRYQDALGLRPSSGERIAEGKLPSFFASMIGNEKIVAVIDTVYRSLSPEEQGKCGIYGENYALSGAVDFYGGKSGLPRAISGHNSYWLWGTRGYSGDVFIIVGGSARDLEKYFGEVTERARFRDEFVQPMYYNLPVYLVRKPKQSLESLWPHVKHYI